MGFDVEKMKKLREKLALTQQEAAEKAGMSTRQAWNNIESGRQSPTIETAEKIAKALGVKLPELLK